RRGSAADTGRSSFRRWGSPSPTPRSYRSSMSMSASDLRDALSLAVVALGSALPISCAGAPELPDAPDVSRLVASYAEPAGSVETSKPAVWLDAAEAQVDLLGGGNADFFVTGL